MKIDNHKNRFVAEAFAVKPKKGEKKIKKVKNKKQ
jgi:hypothetical protein